MAASGFTPISLYYSTTAAAEPTAGNLVSGELAINIADGKLFYKNSSGNVRLLSIGYGSSTVTPTNGGVQYGTGSALALTAAGSSGQILRSNGAAAPTWADLSSLGVNTISFGSTGLTPSTATSGAVTVAGTLITSNGGTGLSSYTAGDMVYYSTGTTLTKLAVGAANRVMTSSGSAPQWVDSLTGLSSVSSTAFTENSYPVVSQSDIGTAPNEIPLNQYLGSMAYQDGDTSDITVYGVRVGRGAGAVATNTAVGNTALYSNITGATNTAVGSRAGYFVTSSDNTLVGNDAGRTITTGSNNTALGSYVMNNSAGVTGQDNVGIGRAVLSALTGGSYNTAVGGQSLVSNTTASYNTAVGWQALNASNRTADTNGYNTAIGYGSGSAITTGQKNTIIGAYTGNQGGLDIRTSSNYIVLSDGDGNPRFYGNGNGAFTVGNSITALNQAAGVMLLVADYNNGGYGCISIGAPSGNYGSVGYGFAPTSTGFIYSVNDYSSRINFGSNITTYTSPIGSISNGIVYTQGPYVANGGTSWTSSSDARLKNVTGGITGALAKVQAMNPVWFSWKRDAANAQNLGFIAQELHQVLPEVVDVPTHETDPRSGEQNYWGVNYTEIVPLLTAAIQELKSELDTVKAELAALKGA